MIIVSMFDESGNALRPWAVAGHQCHAFDWVNVPHIERFASGGSIEYHWADFTDIRCVMSVISLRPDFVMGWPDCTHLAVSGSLHFADKLAKDPDIQRNAVRLARTVEFVGMMTGAPWMAENPVSMLSSMWRKSNYRFDPCHYGGYLPSDDVHPRWPEYIPPRDAYTKKTCIWSGNGFVMPPRMPVDPIVIEYENGVKGSPQFSKLGGKSKKTKQIRSEGPRGFLNAVFYANAKGA